MCFNYDQHRVDKHKHLHTYLILTVSGQYNLQPNPRQLTDLQEMGKPVNRNDVGTQASI
jgi:hypothetical protein